MRRKITQHYSPLFYGSVEELTNLIARFASTDTVSLTEFEIFAETDEDAEKLEELRTLRELAEKHGLKIMKPEELEIWIREIKHDGA